MPNLLTFDTDKHDFFRQRNLSLPEIKQRAQQHRHDFLLKNELEAQQEFNHLQASLSHNRLEDQNYRNYCYYCCNLLSTLYDKEFYDDPTKHTYYVALAETMEHPNRPIHSPAARKPWQVQMHEDFMACLDMPRHSSKLRFWIAVCNVYRIALTFARLTMQQAVILVAKAEWLQRISELLQLELTAEAMTARLKGPVPVFNALSVLFFVARLMVDLGVMLKHTFFSSGRHEQNASLWLRLVVELRKNYANLLNDVVWATLNGLTNYAQYTKISNVFANQLLVAGLVFDVALLAVRMIESEGNHQFKLKKYHLQLQREGEPNPVLQQQIDALHLEIITMRATFATNLAAGTFLASGYSASLVLLSTTGIMLSYFSVLLGVVMYLSADACGKYLTCKLIERDHMSHQNLTAADTQATQQAWDTLTRSLIFNTTMPMALMAVLAVSWQVTLGMILLVIAKVAYDQYAPLNDEENVQVLMPT